MAHGLLNLVRQEKMYKSGKSRKEFSERERFIKIEPSALSLDIDFQLKYKNKVSW